MKAAAAARVAQNGWRKIGPDRRTRRPNARGASGGRRPRENAAAREWASGRADGTEWRRLSRARLLCALSIVAVAATAAATAASRSAARRVHLFLSRASRVYVPTPLELWAVRDEHDGAPVPLVPLYPGPLAIVAGRLSGVRKKYRKTRRGRHARAKR